MIERTPRATRQDAGARPGRAQAVAVGTTEAGKRIAARVRSLDETLAEEQARTRAFAHTMEWERQPREIHLPTLGFKVDGEVLAPSSPPPALGADTADVLKDLGYGAADLRRRAEAKVI